MSFPFSTKAVRVDQPLGSFFVVALPAELLLSVAFSDAMVATLRSDGDGYDLDGTQRLSQPKRLVQIGQYIDRSDAAFPNSIILAANFRQDGLIEDEEGQEEDEQAPLGNGNRRWSISQKDDGCYALTIPTSSKLAAIIDGQHRLFAFAEATRKERLQMELLCSIYLDLPKPYQAQLFATINSTQKPVDKSLTYELFGYNISEEEPRYWSPDKLAVFFTRKLGTDPLSPLFGRIVIAPKKDASFTETANNADWRISTAVAVEGIMRLFSSNPKRDTQYLLTPFRKERASLAAGAKDKSPLRSVYFETNDKLIYTLIFNYISACNDVFWRNAAQGSFIVKTVGVQALFDVLRRFFAASALSGRDVSVDYFAKQLAPAGGIDFSADEYKNASGSGRSFIRRAIESKLGLG
ncbi:MAG: DGQHR domain-containing protein [Mesorhizobium sp.]|nr:MAG: DGQHR domain-containing protein [Mesorhizobium sp.]